MTQKPINTCLYRISVKALVLNEDRTKFLITQEDNGKWELPGGGLDWREDPKTCLTRELQEEMSINVVSVAPNPSYFITVEHLKGHAWVANVLYETVVENLEFKPSNECVAIRFVDLADIKYLDVFPNVLTFAKVFIPKRD